jgi:hypothetical protein
MLHPARIGPSRNCHSPLLNIGFLKFLLLALHENSPSDDRFENEVNLCNLVHREINASHDRSGQIPGCIVVYSEPIIRSQCCDVLSSTAESSFIDRNRLTHRCAAGLTFFLTERKYQRDGGVVSWREKISYTFWRAVARVALNRVASWSGIWNWRALFG